MSTLNERVDKLGISKSFYVSHGSTVYDDMTNDEIVEMSTSKCNDEEIKPNIVLITDALNTANKCGYLPSDLLKRRDELIEAIKCHLHLSKKSSNVRAESTLKILNLIKNCQ